MSLGVCPPLVYVVEHRYRSYHSRTTTGHAALTMCKLQSTHRTQTHNLQLHQVGHRLIMSGPAPTPPWVLEMYASARRAKARAADADAAAPPVAQPLPPADTSLPRAARPAAGEASSEADGIPPVDELQALVSRGVRLVPSWAAKLVAAVPAATPSTAIPAHAAALGAYRPSRGWVAGVPAAGHSRFVLRSDALRSLRGTLVMKIHTQHKSTRNAPERCTLSTLTVYGLPTERRHRSAGILSLACQRAMPGIQSAPRSPPPMAANPTVSDVDGHSQSRTANRVIDETSPKAGTTWLDVDTWIDVYFKDMKEWFAGRPDTCSWSVCICSPFLLASSSSASMRARHDLCTFGISVAVSALASCFAENPLAFLLGRSATGVAGQSARWSSMAVFRFFE